MGSSLKFVLALGLLASAAWATGCVPVRAIDHGKLAHPTMTPEAIMFGLEGHVRAVSEGASGSLGGGGGGCGCN